MISIKSSAAKTTLALVAVSAVSKLLGLVRESSLAYYFGAGPETDAYKLAFGVPNLLLSTIISSLAITFIPVYAGYIKNKAAESNYFLNNIINITGLIAIVLTLPGMTFAGPLVRLMAPGFEGNTWRLAVDLTVIILPSLIFISLSNLSNSFLQTHGSFLPGMFIWIPYNLIIIASTVAYSGRNIKTVAVGSFIAAACMFLFQLPYMVRKGFRFRAVLDFREEGFRRILLLMLPVFIGGLSDQLYIIIYRRLASGFDAGSLSSLDFADRINNIFYSLFIVTIITVLYPGMASVADNALKLAQSVEKGIRSVILASFPIIAVLLILRFPIVNILFERGAFNMENTRVTAAALGFFSVGTLGAGMRETLNRAFYAMNDTRTPMLFGAIAVCINIFLNLFLPHLLGVGGLALSAALSAIFCSIALLVRLTFKIRYLRLSDLGGLLWKAAAAALAMGAVMHFVNGTLLCEYLNISVTARLFRLALIVVTGTVTYICLLKISGIKDLDFIFIRAGFRLNGGVCMKRYAVIMAGGNGERFWPFSREKMPKQFLNLTGSDIMLNETIKRIQGIVSLNNVFVATNSSHREIIERLALKELPRGNILYEPQVKNTAACIAYCAVRIDSLNKEALMCILPSDHYISEGKSFQDILEQAFSLAKDTGKLVTIGIKPSYPSTAYGYLKCGKACCTNLKTAYQVDEFIEKPDSTKASVLLENGSYLWNTGIIVCKVSTMLDNIRRFLPKIHRAFLNFQHSIGTSTEQAALKAAYAELPGISIDYGVMERSEELLVIPGDFKWSDMGGWDTICSIYTPDKDNNIIRAMHAGLDTSNSVIFGGDRLIATIGVDNLIVVECGDAILVCHKDRAQEVKKLIEMMKKSSGFNTYL